MAALDYEKLAAAAKKAVKRKSFPIGDVKVELRELLRPELAALDARLWVYGPDGKPLMHTDGKPDPNGKDVKQVEGVHFLEEWIAATMEPAVTVDQLLGPEWPDSLIIDLYNAARAVNGYEAKDAVKN